MVAHASNPGTQELEAGLSLSPAWPTSKTLKKKEFLWHLKLSLGDVFPVSDLLPV
jgi:hypothetical protein